MSYLLVATVLSLIPTRPEVVQCPEKSPVFVASNGIHLDLILPRELVDPDLLGRLDPPEWVQFLAFGWGDKEFYINTPTWDDLELTTALRALFTDSEAAVHVVWLKNGSSEWIELSICPEQAMRLNQYLVSTFAAGPSGQLIEIEAAGYSSNDRFYQAVGNFSIFQTCNQWVNKGLKTAQVRTSVWSPFDKGLLYQVRRTQEAGMGE
jgi:uncharacterized protein (TIGR02117 family)